MTAGVSRAIRTAGGQQIVAEANRYAWVRPGRAVVTTAGDLKARYVFHGVTLDQPSGFVRPTRDLIIEIMRSCFYHAESLGVRSIAFPLLGTGTGGFSREICLDTMFRFAATLLRRATPISDLRIVIY